MADEREPIDTQIVGSQRPIETESLAPLEQVAQNLANIRPKEDPLVTVSAKFLRDVLPLKFYEGASEMKLNADELSKLAEFTDATDDIVDIRPDGLIYVQHIHYRRALTALFGTEWALLPGSAVEAEKGKMTVYQRWVLVVRGKFIGEAVGAAVYYEDDKWSDKSFATEGAVSEAVRRICAKSALGIFSNVWDRKFARDWKHRCAVQVWAPSKAERKKLWRRIDDDPFEGEIGPVVKEPPRAGKESDAKSQASRAAKVSVHDDESTGSRSDNSGTSVGSVAPQLPLDVSRKQSPPEKIEDSKIKPEPITTEPATPGAAQAPAVEMVNEGNFRLFIMEARRKKLVDGDFALPAVALICETVSYKAAPQPKPGEKQIEVLRRVFFALSRQEFNDKVMPKVRQAEVWVGQEEVWGAKNNRP